MNILLAISKQDEQSIASVLRGTRGAEHSLNFLDTQSSLEEAVGNNIQLALIDEDFNGLQTGWELATHIRQYIPQAKIVMIVRKNPSLDLKLLYDVTLRFPIGEDELIKECQRPWPAMK